MLPSSVLLLAVACTLADPTTIDRKTFSMSLPDKWIEWKTLDGYDPNYFIIFDGPESPIFIVFMGRKQDGASIESYHAKWKDRFAKKLSNPTINEIKTWSSFEGKGTVIEGTSFFVKERTTIFAFERGDTVCLVLESASLDDYGKFAKDFDMIRQSFKLK